TWTRLVSQPIESTLHKPLPPLAHRLRPHPHFSSHLLVGFTCCTTQHNATPLRQRLRGLRPPRPPLQRLALLIGQHHRSHRTAPFRHRSSLQLINQLPAQDTRLFCRAYLVLEVRSLTCV